MSGSDVYNALVTTNQVNPDSYGLAVLPLADSPDAGILGGGSVAAVSAKASPDEQEAAVAVERLLPREEELRPGRRRGRRQGAQGERPADRYADAADLRRGHLAEACRTRSRRTSTCRVTRCRRSPTALRPGPDPRAGHHTQEVYAILDSVVQKVLTDENADIDALLADANEPGPGAARLLTGPGRPARPPRHAGRPRPRSRRDHPEGTPCPRSLTPTPAAVRAGSLGGPIVFLLPMLLVVRALLVVADRPLGRHERAADQPRHAAGVRRPRQLPRRARRPAARHRRAEHALVRAARAGLRLPGAADPRGDHERRTPGPRPLLAARLPAGGDPARGRRAALAVLLRRRADRASSTRSSAGSASGRCPGWRTPTLGDAVAGASRRPGRPPAAP